MMYQHIYMYFYAMILIIVGALNWGIIGAYGTNLIEKYIPLNIVKIIYILVGVSAVYLLMDRNTYLPFLNDTVLPCYNLEEQVPPKFDTLATVKVPANTKVIYWAALPDDGKGLKGPEEAYGDYSNSGITISSEQGEAVLRIQTPQPYKVNKFGFFPKTLEPHVHYRFCRPNGMMSEVKTHYI
jgi:uncharacterized membrane protein YuzA (DUF378 family)